MTKINNPFSTRNKSKALNIALCFRRNSGLGLKFPPGLIFGGVILGGLKTGRYLI